MPTVPSLPQIPAEEMSPLIKKLVGITHQQAEIIQQLKTKVQQLRDEIAILKGEKPKPQL